MSTTLVTTTLSAAFAATDASLTVASASGIAAGYKGIVDGEDLQVLNTYVAGSTTVPVIRGQNGTIVAAHASGANVSFAAAQDIANASPQLAVTYPLAGRGRLLTSYSASGAITLPTAGADAVAVLNGTSTLAMTLAAPGKDLDGSVLTIVGNGKSASAVTVAGGLGNASTGYTVVTFQTGAQGLIELMACNGAWCFKNAPWSGTTTAITIAIA